MRDFTLCPRCHQPTQKSTTFNNNESEFWLECTNPECNTYINTYIPQEHQRAVHEDDHTYVGNFGAYGTGKTLTTREELYKHIFITPNANALIGANVSAQYEQTIKRDIESDLPRQFISGYSAQKSYYDFINGSRLMFRPFDNPDKLRSLNLTFFGIIEASEVKGESFHQLKTRLRNLNATYSDPAQTILGPNGEPIPVITQDWRKGIIESNPDSGWIRTDVLYAADDIKHHGNTIDHYVVPEDQKDPAISVHVASTDVNRFLPPNFIDELIKNKPAWWVHRFIHSSFSYAEGLVYPNAAASYCDPFFIPPEWKRIIACDYGLSDNFVYLYGAIDEKNGILYIYKEVVTKDRDMDSLAKLYYENSSDIPQGNLLFNILDPKSGAKRDYNKKTLYDHFLDRGIAFQPGHVNLDARILRTNTYFESGRVRIFNTCRTLKEELDDYKFPEKKLTKKRNVNEDKPVDKNNHCINPLEWICMALPSDPRRLLYGVYNKDGIDVTKDIKPQDRIIPFALQEQHAYDSFDGAYDIDMGGIF